MATNWLDGELGISTTIERTKRTGLLEPTANKSTIGCSTGASGSGQEGRTPICLSGALALNRSPPGKLSVNRRPRTTLVMLSGGVDSTYTLTKLLRETDDDVLAHHIVLVNGEGRHAIELERCRQIVAWCSKHIRPFRYSESLLDHRAFEFFGYDMVAVGFQAGVVVRSHQTSGHGAIDYWAIGHCAEEPTYAKRWPHVVAVLNSSSSPFSPPIYLDQQIVTKKQEIEYIGSHLSSLAWTCRMPALIDGQYEECGKCMTCSSMQDIRDSNMD